MLILMAVLAGSLYAAGVYMILRRGIVKLLLGLALMSHAVHLLIFTAGGLTRANPPLIADGATQLAAGAADPLPQALILTAIVISFGVTAFGVVLARRTCEEAGTDDLDQMNVTEHHS